MTTDFRALCAELLADYEQHLYRSVLADRARAALAEPEPEGPQPVPVSEWLPYDSDRNAKGECWWMNPGDDETGPFWCLYEGPCNPLLEGITHWLPAHALPVPGEGEA